MSEVLITIRIKTDNAAFEDDRHGAVVAITREVVERFRNYEFSGTLRDYNGNTVGDFSWTEQAEARESHEPGCDVWFGNPCSCSPYKEG